MNRVLSVLYGGVSACPMNRFIHAVINIMLRIKIKAKILV